MSSVLFTMLVSHAHIHTYILHLCGIFLERRNTVGRGLGRKNLSYVSLYSLKYYLTLKKKLCISLFK